VPRPPPTCPWTCAAWEPPNIGGEGVLDTTYEGYTAAELPDRLESGLQNYAGIVGSAAALQWLEGVGWEALARHDLALNRQLTDALGQLQGVRLVGPAQPEKRGSIVNFVLDGVDSIELAHLLDRSEGIMVRAGKHCAHSWYNAHGIPDSVRVSLYAYNTPDEVDRLIRVLSNIAHEFR
jgi:cysteine desulfurase/selenocysteine lyase